MKKIKILHWYYDILNIYGENGNMKALVRALERQGLDVIIDFKTIDDDIKIDSYDFIYLGSGINESIDIVKEDIKKYKDDLIKYINDNKYLLATGNSIELFSNLDILNYKTKRIDFRIVGDQIFKTDLIDKKIIGFQNRESVIEECNEDSLFEVITGTGWRPNEIKEGIHKKNFYGTYLVGPLLIRNPYLLDYLVKRILKDKKIPYKKVSKDISYKAYEEFLDNFGRE